MLEGTSAGFRKSSDAGHTYIHFYLNKFCLIVLRKSPANTKHAIRQERRAGDIVASSRTPVIAGGITGKNRFKGCSSAV